MRIWGEQAGRRWDVVAIVILVVWLIFDLTARTFFGSVSWPDSVVDYHILYEASNHVVDTYEYPIDKPYPYPPPAVAIHAASAVFPFPVSAAFWLTLTGLAALTTYAVLARVLDLRRFAGLLFALPLAHLVVAYYFQWDMRSLNCNLIVLAAVVLGAAALNAQRNAATGFCFALAVAMKLLPVLLLPYLAWTRRWRAFGWMACFSLLFWVALPILAFGTTGFSEVYTGWGGELARATDPNVKHYHPIIISLDKAAFHATDQDTSAARVLMWSVCALWVGAGLIGAIASRMKRNHDGFAILAHVSLLIVGPAAVNPYLEPYHLVPLVVPSVLLLLAAADMRQRAWVRLGAVVGFTLGLLILKASSPWELRGLLVNAQALVLCGTASLVAWARVVHTAVPDAVLPVQIKVRSRVLTRPPLVLTK